MQFKLQIECDNAAFGADDTDRHDEVTAAPEIARILRAAADKVEAGDTVHPLFDVNGNRVGEFRIDPDTRAKRR